MDEFNELIEKSNYNNYLKEIMPNKNNSNEIIYIRFSTERQGENSPLAQLNDILDYCLLQNIYVPKENIFVDFGISGRTATKRDKFQSMITYATNKKNNVKLVLVHKYNRFARNREDSIMYKSKLKKCGIKIIAVKELLPTDKKMALILENQYETNSEIYSLDLSDEVYKGLKIQAEAGNHITRPPFGYHKEFVEVTKVRNREKIIRKMVVDETEAKIIKLIYQKFINGTTEYQIARDLNELGLKTRDGHKWYDNRVRAILDNVTYKGYTHWTQKNVENPEAIIAKGKFEAIIDEETWNKAHTIRELKHNCNIERTQVKHPHWLRGKIRCSDCGEMLVLNGESFQCCAYTHGWCKVSHSIKINKMEKNVIAILRMVSVDETIKIDYSEMKMTEDDTTAILKEEIKNLEKKKSRIMDAYENGIYELEEFKNRKNKIETEISQTSNLLKQALIKNNTTNEDDKIRNKCGELAEALQDDEISVLDKQIMFDQVVDTIVFDKKNKIINFYYKKS